MRLLRNPPKKPLIQFFYILKASLLLNYLPTCWKTAIIIHIPKLMRVLMRVVDTIANEHNKKRLSAMVLLDLNKAFDSVWHDGLLLKHNNPNFPAHILSIISSFLKNRFLTVKINKTYSQLKSIPAGVPKS